MSANFILASGSTYKRAQLERLGIPFSVVSAEIEEMRDVAEAPAAFAERLAREKALAVQATNPGCWVLGVDQVIALGDEVFSKPETHAVACEQLGRMQGRTHTLLTAMCMVSPSGMANELVKFEMTMRSLTAVEIARYVELDEPLDCAGSYKIEEAGIRLFESCLGDDFTAIIGLACTRVRPMLERTHYPGPFDE